MKKIVAVILTILFIFLFACSNKSIKISTTTSVYDSGLLNFILPEFEKRYKIKVDVISVGSGQAAKLMENGDVDLLLIHEKSFMDDLLEKGKIKTYNEVFSNYFIIVGPVDKKNSFKKDDNVFDILKTIKDRNYIFLTRFDNSATYIKEKKLWEMAKITPTFSNYKKTGQGMGMTLNMAEELKAFTISDIATYLSMRDKLKDLTIIYDGKNDSHMKNIYYIGWKKGNISRLLFNWINSEQCKKLIKKFNQMKYNYEVYQVR